MLTTFLTTRAKQSAMALPAVLFFLALFTVPASALPITALSVTAGDANVGSVLVSPDPNDAKGLAAAFELTASFANLSLEIPLTCLQCQAQFFLMQSAIGPASDFVSNVRAVTTVDTLLGGGFINSPTQLFSGLSLNAGHYFLVMALTSDTLSGAIWAATQAPIVTAMPEAVQLADFIALTGGYNSTTPPLSVFTPYQINGIDTFLQFSLTAADPGVPIPEPASWLLLLTGLIFLWCRGQIARRAVLPRRAAGSGH